MIKLKQIQLFGIAITIVCIALMPFQSQATTQNKQKTEGSTKERLVLMPLRVPAEDKNLNGAMETALIKGLQQKYDVFSGEQVSQKAHEIFMKESHNAAHKECDETKCMQNIAMAFQAELIASANVTKQDGIYYLVLSIQNIFDNKMVYSESLPCENCNGAQVIGRLKELSGIIAPVVETPQSKVAMNYPDTALRSPLSSTNTYKFAGTSWRAPNAYNDTIEFRESGVVAYKSSRGYSYGQWKFEKGVLLFDNNNYSHYEARIDGDWLVVNANNPNNRWSTRWYRTDNEKIDKEVKKDFDQSIEDFRNNIEAHRLSVLNESPETEAMLQQGKGVEFKGQHWISLCDDISLRDKAISISSSTGKSQSELCYNWYGTRHDWKEKILKEGCQGRCRP